MQAFSLYCSAEKAALMSALAAALRTWPDRSSDEPLDVEPSFLPDEKLIEAVLTHDLPLICPRSEFSLTELESRWRQRFGDEGSVKARTAFAASPVVFFMPAAVLERVRDPDGAVSWHSLSEGQATSSLAVMHAHGSSADGLAVATAAFVATGWSGDGDPDDPAAERARTRVRNLEQQVVGYDADDDAVLRRAVAGGAWNADVVIAQEQAIVRALRSDPRTEGVVVYPAEGTVWARQVVAWTSAWQSSEPEPWFEALRTALATPGIQPQLRSAGLHPLSDAMGTVAETASFVAALGLSNLNVRNPGAPPMVLPGYNAVRVIRRAWSGTKRAVDAVLVLDVSGSMVGRKLDRAKEGARRFTERLEGDDSTIALVAFDTSARVLVPRQSIVTGAARVRAAVDAVSAGELTALVDGVSSGLDELDDADAAHLRALIILSDGQENQSTTHSADVLRRVGERDVRVFGIAYGGDADLPHLEALAAAGRGEVVRASPGDIGKVLEALSSRV